jgi:hypothetical protein
LNRECHEADERGSSREASKRCPHLILLCLCRWRSGSAWRPDRART